MKSFIFVLSSILLVGCGSIPMSNSAGEFVLASKKHSGIKTYQNDVNISLNKVMTIVKSKAIPCMDGRVTTIIRQQGGGDMTRITDYNIKLQKINDEFYRVTMQLDKPKGVVVGKKPPKGGMYFSVIDIKKVARNKTRINGYVAFGYATYFHDPIIDWANGKEGGCWRDS